jgi:hypothetical protein
MIDFNNKKFRSIETTANGEVSGDTIFHYWQEGNVVWANYKGGNITFGNLVAKTDRNGNLDMRYQHVNGEGEIQTGKCKSTPEILEDGKIRLHESWEWTSGDLSKGESIVEEIRS